MKITFVSLSLLLFASANFAQGIIERKIVNIAKPSLPAEAEVSGLGGTVRVSVTVDSAGNVTAVGNAFGPDWVCATVVRPDVIALREAAKAIAAGAKFAPLLTRENGTPSEIIVNVEFPSRIEEGEAENYSAAPVSEKATSDKPATPGEKFTIIGNSRATVAASSPPDYVGPVQTVPPTNSPDRFSVRSDGTAPIKPGKSLRGGVLNGKAVVLPRPQYPPAARAVRAAGAVSIQVLIDEDGKVFSAQAVSGHPLLRMAARQAACGAEFQPTQLSGKPVKVSGIITYNFVP